MKKIYFLLAALLLSVGLWAEGSESMANISKQTYEWTDVTNYTGDNGLAWKAVGAQDAKISGFKALAVHSSVNGNGLSGNLTAQQTAEGVGTVSFMVKGAEAGTGYGNRTFRVTAGSKSVNVTVNVPNMSNSYQFDAKVDVTGASTLAITMLESVSGETASFYIYNIRWTSFSGKTDMPSIACNAQFVANGTDTTYYTTETATVRLSCPMENATLYYTTNGSEPTQSSTQGNSFVLGIGTHTVKAVAWTAEMGLSDVATKVLVINKATIAQYTADNADLPGEYGTISNPSLQYNTLSGQPYYQLNAQKSFVITEAAIRPYGISCYAKNGNNRTLTVAWQSGTISTSGDESTFEPTSDWADILTISDFATNDMKRFEILVPAAAKDKTVRFRFQTSGTSMYVDDIVLIAEDIKRAGDAPVIEPVHPTGVTLSQTSATLEEGETVVLTATVAPADAENKEVTWSTSDAYVATVVNGTVTAVHAGTATITVTTVDGGLTASCAITVNAPEPIHPTGVTLSQTSATLEEGETVVLTATVAPADAENKEVTWSTSDANVATVVNGTVTAVHAGTATITVTTVDGGLTASCAITVNAPEPPQGIDDVEAEKTVRKMVRNGQVFILREQTIYSVDGREVKK